MNKRFSTLLAIALVAGGMSAFANDAYNGPTFTPNGGDPTTPKNKEQVLLNVLTADAATPVAGGYLTITSGSLSLGAKPTTIAGYKGFTWAVTVKTTASGVVASDPIYTFTNKAASQVLRVKLQTDGEKTSDGKGQSVAPAKISGDGNAEWGWRADVGLYAQKGDSTFYFDASMKLCAVKGGVDKVTAPGNIVSYVPLTATDEITLAASDFATVLKDGKVYFNNGKDVKNAKNILTDNVWTAYKNNANNAFFLAVKDKKTKSGNPYLLMVDTAYYDTAAKAYHALVADTLSLDLTGMAALTGGTYNEANYNPTDLTKYARPINAALFTGKYYPMNDSIVLTVKGEPAKNYKSAIIDGSKQYGVQVADVAAVTGAQAADIPGYTEANAETGNAMKNLATAVSNWLTEAVKDSRTADGYNAKFAGSLFTTNALANGGTAANAAGGVLTAAQAWVKDDANKTNTKLAKFKAFVKAAEGLQRIAAEASGTAFFIKGLPQRAAGTDAATIALRELNDTKVLTVATSMTGYIEPLVQPYKTAPDFGGTADVDVTKVYYLKDLNKYRDNKENKGEGFFFNESPVAQSEYLAEGQAFNPYSQYVFVKTAGAAKGSYTIYNRGTGDAWSASGLTDVLGSDSIVIGTDSLMLVDANIAYTGKDVEKQIGYKFAPEYDLVNKSFMIHSASPYMKDLYLHMKNDSSIMVAADEVLYNLEAAVAPVQYGAKVAGIDTLEYQPYYIKTAKGEYLVLNEAGNGYILTKDENKYNEELSYTDANGATKKYNAVKTAFYFIATDNADTYVLVEAEPEQDASATSKALSYEFNDQKATVNAQSGILESSDKEVRNDLFYVATEPTPASLFTAPKHVQLKAINGDLVAVGKDNFGAVAREGDLKAAYEKVDFTFWLDTARYTDNEGKDLVTPSYYVTKGIAAVEGTEDTEAVAAKRLYMYVAADSAKDATIDKEQYTYDGKTRIQFRDAVRYGADSLVVAGDTLTLDGKATATIAEPKKGINYFRFNFLVDKDNEGYYNILNENKYVQNVNGTLVVTAQKADALKVAVEDAEAPTANEGVEVSEVTVIAGEGQVTIAGAAGKKVVISNILGQTVANTVITSDNAIISAPQGVVVVAVEGEEAVKAIVK
ncbi:DUF6383 domain-containing protein [Parabacteroides sp.]